MLLFLICTSFRPFEGKRDCYYRPINIRNSQSVKSQSPGWHYIKVKDSSVISEFSEIFTSQSKDNPVWYTSYLSESQISKLKKANKTILYPIEKQYKNIKSNVKDARYLVHASKSFIDKVDHSLFSEVKIVADGYYALKSSNLNSSNEIQYLIDSPEVLSFSELPKIKLYNRWAKGFVQNGDNSIGFDGHTYTGKNSLNQLGYLGENYVVTMEDSGLDTTLRYFKDPKISVPFNSINKNHRKIVKYKSISKSDLSDFSGHGTHCAGSICGENIDDSDYFSAYNGGAPKAKLFVVDLEDANGNMYVDIDFSNTIADMKNLNSFISSNSWGLETVNTQVKSMYDQATSDNPQILWVFAAGNSFGAGTVGIPASAKNILTVGALNTIHNVNLEIRSKTAFDLVADDGYKVISPTFLYTTSYDPIMSSLSTQKAINSFNKTAVLYSNSTESYSDSAVYATSCEEAADAVKRGCTLILTNGAYTCDSSSLEGALVLFLDKSVSFFQRLSGKQVSLLPRVKDSEKQNSVASFSSRGPGMYGAIKPEVVAPGSSILSACNQNDNRLKEMSGTSMACPTVAGEMVLLREYITKEFGIESPTSNLLKAFAVCGATKPNNPSIPDNEWGFGMLNIGNVVEAISGNKVLIQNELMLQCGKLLSFELKVVNANRPVSIAMAYIDKPTSAQSLISLVVDLDLFVVTPNGELLHPIGNSEDQYSTVERIFIESKNVEIGTYKVYVKSSIPQAGTPKSVKVSLVAIGNISSFDATTASSSIDLAASNSPWTDVCSSPSFATADGCKCDDKTTGLFCQHEVINIPIGSSQVYRIPSMETVYIKAVLSNMEDGFNLNLYQQQTMPNYVIIHTNPNSLPDKISNYVFTNVFNQSKLSLTGYSGESFFPNSPVYFAIANMGTTECIITASLTVDQDPEYSDVTEREPKKKSLTVAQIAIIVVICIIAAFIVFFFIYNCIRRKSKSVARNRNQPHNQSANNNLPSQSGGGSMSAAAIPAGNNNYVPPSYPSAYNNSYPYAQNMPPPSVYPPAPNNPYSIQTVDAQPVYMNEASSRYGDERIVNPYDPSNFPSVNANNSANRPSYYPPMANPDDDK